MAKSKIKLPTTDTPVPATINRDEQRKYRAEDGLRTCEQYAKIKSDKGLMSDIRKLAKDKIKQLGKVAAK